MDTARLSPLRSVRLGACGLSGATFLVAVLVALLPTAMAALPGEPTVEVTVAPGDVTLDASGINAVDTSFAVNVSGHNLGPRPHTMWVNISFSTSAGWKVNPSFQNLTLSLAAQATDTVSIPVTVTVPPGVSANNVTVFTASFREENDLRFSQGDAGNRTSQIHIRQIYSTAAEFNGTSSFTINQGQDANYTIKVTNRGNGDATYDAQLLNADALRPSDVLLKSTTSAVVAMNATAIVRVVIHANPPAIPGPYQIQIRVFATGTSGPPTAGAYADLTGFLTVRSSATPPPPGGGTTQPPPANNNTTGGGNPPPPTNGSPSGVSFIDGIAAMLSNPIQLAALVLISIAILVGLLFWRHSRKVKRARKAALEKARSRRPLAQPVGPSAASGVRAGPRPVQVASPMRTTSAVRPVRRPAGPK